MSANWIDAVLIAVMLLSVTLATLRGFMHSAFGLAAVIVAFTLALARGGLLTQPIDHILESPNISGALSHAVVFVAALVACGALGKFIRGAVRKMDLGGLDRFVGFLFGLMRGGIIAVIIVLAVAALPVENSRAWQESALTPVAGTVAFFFLGQGGMLETSLWTYDERRRPSLDFSFRKPATPAPEQDSDSDSDSDPEEGADREELSAEEKARRPRKARREAKREARLEARRRKSGEYEDQGESGDEPRSILDLNDRAIRQAEKILQEENPSCGGSESGPCAE